MRQYRFWALIALDPAACADAGSSGLGGMLACCLVEPSRHAYFPAAISTDGELPARTKASAVVTVALHDSEASAFFTAGQRFTIWADAIVGHTIQAAGLVGYGLICPGAALPAASAPSGTAGRPAALPAVHGCPATETARGQLGQRVGV